MNHSYSGISVRECVWGNSVTLMDSFISLAPFMSLWGSLLASQTKVSVCASSLRPSWDSGKELDTCCIGVRIHERLRSHMLLFERRNHTPFLSP